MNAIGIIPARYASSRFPGKPLADILGKPMIQWVYERANRAQLLEKVIVATDDQRIFNAVNTFGGKVVMTSPTAANSTERVAEVAQNLETELVINIQGDEPLIDPGIIDQFFLYIYRREFLLKFVKLPISNLERIERLEQLRILENGYKIKVTLTDTESIGVDVPSDIDRVISYLGVRKIKIEIQDKLLK